VLSGGMRAVGPAIAVAAHCAGSSATVVAASECVVSTSGATAVASEIEGATFVLAFVAGSSTVA
jgi:hypothetical protein